VEGETRNGRGRAGGGLTDLDGGDAEAAGLEDDPDAAGRDALPEPADHAAGHQHVLHDAFGGSISWRAGGRARGARGRLSLTRSSRRGTRAVGGGALPRRGGTEGRGKRRRDGMGNGRMGELVFIFIFLFG
jgi:hypothetical protein